MKTIRTIGMVILIIIIFLLVISLFLPKIIRVERSVVIQAPVETIFGQVNTLKNWENWSARFKMDTAVHSKYSGAASGEGAVYEWKSGKPKVGEGKITITRSVPFDSISTEILFSKNMKTAGSFIFKKADGGTKVSWLLEENAGNNPIQKIIGLFMGKIVGPDIEKGLAGLKNYCEKQVGSTEYEVEEIRVNRELYVSISEKCNMKNMKQVIEKIYGKLMEFTTKNGIKCIGPPFSIYHGNPNDTVWILEAGFPVDKKLANAGEIEFKEFTEGNALTTMHIGPYSKVGPAYEAIMKFAAKNNKKIIGSPRESYLNDPMEVKDSTKFQTRIYFPVE